jgi:hypothetical protein
MAELAIPVLEPGTDVLTAALAYAGAGLYVGPIDRHKPKNPGSVLGKGWPAKTSTDPRQITAWFAGTSLGLFLHVGRSGLLVLDVDYPEKMPAVMRDGIEQHKPPFQSTREGEPGRGHYIWAMPPGRNIGNGKGELGGDWGEVRGRNGVIVLEPTPHHKPGGRYQMHPGAVPVLPDTLSRALPDQHSAEDAVTREDIQSFLERHTAAERPALVDGVVRKLRASIEAGEGRHPSAVTAACWAAREAQAGLYDARKAFGALYGVFSEALSGESDRNPAAEWTGIVSWAIGQAPLEDPAATRARVGDPFTETTTAPESAPESERDSWTPVDLTEVLTGQHARVVPTLGLRNDGVRLLYPAKEHSLAAEPECGKTWLMLLIVADILREDGRVVFIDFEDDEGTIVERLLTLGILPDRLTMAGGQFRYVRPEIKPAAGVLERLFAFPNGPADLVCYDGVTEGMSLLGLKVADGVQTDAAAWRSALVKPALRLGAATLASDHVVKDEARRGRYAIGDQHKLAGLNGVQFLMEQGDPFGRGLKGRSRVLVSKDRNGGLRQHGKPTDKPGITHLGDLVGDATSGELDSLIFWPPFDGDKDTATADRKLIANARKMLSVLRDAPRAYGTRDLEAAMKPMRKSDVGEAAVWLERQGFIFVDIGKSKAHSFRSAPEDWDALIGPPSPNVPDRPPGDTRDRPPSPAPKGDGPTGTQSAQDHGDIATRDPFGPPEAHRG